MLGLKADGPGHGPTVAVQRQEGDALYTAVVGEVGSSSTLTLPTFRDSACSAEICSTTGASCRQGPHQGASQSTKTGTVESRTSVSKLAPVMTSSLRI